MCIRDRIKAAAQAYQADMTRFLRDMISHPSESCEEREVVHCIKAEMEKLGYDKVEIDGLGNVIGWMGDGDKIIAIDSHIDTVGVGNIDNWTHDPYQGYEDDQVIYGRGGSDQEGGMASVSYTHLPMGFEDFPILNIAEGVNGELLPIQIPPSTLIYFLPAMG